MKASMVLSLATALLVTGPVTALSLFYQSWETPECGGTTGSMNHDADIAASLDNKGEWTGDCQPTSKPMSCMYLQPANDTGDVQCAVNIFSDKACGTRVGDIKVEFSDVSKHAEGNVKWESLNLNCKLSPIQIIPITPLDQWTDAVNKGKALWRLLQDKLAESDPRDKEGGKELLEDYDEIFENGEDKKRPPPDIQYELQALGSETVKPEYYEVELRYHNRIVFDNEYSVSQGVIIGSINNRGNDEHPREQQLSLSEAWFWQYARFADQDSQDIKKMRYHFRYSITNRYTTDIIDEVYRREEKDHATTPLEYEPEHEHFFALLGTPNGGTTPYILIDHPVALGKKNVKRVKILAGGNTGRYNMYFTIE